MAQQYRIEHDTMGEVKVPADCYWGRKPSVHGSTFVSVSKRQCRLK